MCTKAWFCEVFFYTLACEILRQTSCLDLENLIDILMLLMHRQCASLTVPFLLLKFSYGLKNIFEVKHIAKLLLGASESVPTLYPYGTVLSFSHSF